MIDDMYFRHVVGHIMGHLVAAFVLFITITHLRVYTHQLGLLLGIHAIWELFDGSSLRLSLDWGMSYIVSRQLLF